MELGGVNKPVVMVKETEANSHTDRTRQWVYVVLDEILNSVLVKLSICDVDHQPAADV